LTGVKIAVVDETGPYERRVALVPETVRRLVGAGHEVAVQSGAGAAAWFADSAFVEAGATVGSRTAVLVEAAAVVRITRPAVADVAELPAGCALLTFLQPAGAADLLRALADRRVDAYSFDLLPRTSRAQTMDALSSQATVTGYRGALLAAERLPNFFPLLMTAAGTVPPARVLVLGAGVAGLQAIATARRLGAVVAANDVRSAAGEEVRSLGATFVELAELESADGAGGYARAQSEDFLARQRDFIGGHVAASSAVITTAAVPGRSAPLLVTAEMVAGMRPGSVIVDLAADGGGNCALTVLGQEVDAAGVAVLGVRNPPSGMPSAASTLFSRNVTALLGVLAPAGALAPDDEDDIVIGCRVTHGGDVVHPAARQALEETS
jgi:NAD(P) transhydrogenase subunit alpha